jgi:hypothetical protein
LDKTAPKVHDIAHPLYVNKLISFFRLVVKLSNIVGIAKDCQVDVNFQLPI